jgi:predicted HTH domain antitoxin
LPQSAGGVLRIRDPGLGEIEESQQAYHKKNRMAVTIALASRLAEMTQREFQHLLAERHIPVHYGIDEFRQDLQTLREIGRL